MSGDVPSDSKNYAFKQFGQRDSGFSLLHYYFSAVLLLSERTLYIDIFLQTALTLCL